MLKTLLLILILLLAGFMAFIPHIGYAYPLHVDEWMHLTYARTIAQGGKQGDFPHSEKDQDEVLRLQTREKCCLLSPAGIEN
jgi:hypothetical protein